MKHLSTTTIIVFLLAAFVVADLVTRWGERPAVEFKVARSCGY